MDTQSVTLLSDGQIKSLFLNEKPDSGFILSTVTVADTLRLKWTGESTLNARVQRCTQWIAICARFKARFCAGQTLRLYRNARSAKKRGATWKRVEDKTRLKYLRSPVLGKLAEYAMDADGIEEVTEHPVLDLLKRPNPFTTGHAFALSRFMDLEICGNGFVYSDQPQEPNGLYRMAPHKTAVIPSRTEFIAGYRYGMAQEVKKDFDVSEVDHYKFMPGLVSPYLGDSWVQDVILDADRYAASTASDLALQTRGGRPDWVFKLPPGSNPDTVAKAREEIKRRVGGPSKAGEILFTTAEEVVPLQWRPKDLEAIASREDAKLIICNAAGVPETMLSMQNANRAGAETGLDQFARVTIAPQLAQDAGELTAMLLPRFPGTEGYWFCYDNPVPDDVAAQTEADVKLLNAGAKTLNQYNAERGYDPIGPDGDVYRFNGVPLSVLATQADTQAATDEAAAANGDAQGEAAHQAAAVSGDVQATALNGTQVASMQALLQSVADGQLPPETARAAIAASYPTLGADQIEAMIGPLVDFTPKPQETSNGQGIGSDNAGGADGGDSGGGTGGGRVSPKKGAANAGSRHGAGDGAGRDGEDGSGRLRSDDADHGDRGIALKHPAFADEAHGRKCAGCKSGVPTDAQQRAIAEVDHVCRQWFDGLGPTVTDVAGEVKLPDGAAETLAGLLRAPLAKLAELAAADAGAEVSAAVSSESALKYLDHYLPKLAQQITTDTRAALADALHGGITAGESIGQLQERVAAVLDDQTNYRAERIARTEVPNIFNRGKLETWKAASIPKKRWLLAPGACEFCQALSAKYPDPVPIDFVFLGVGQTLVGVLGGTMTNMWQPVVAAPLHPNDFCGVIPVVE